MTVSFGTRFGTISVTDSTFAGGAKGDGVTDDAPAFQAAFNAAWGVYTSPHGTGSGRYTNTRVFVPAGNYLIKSPLYLCGIDGGMLFGEGPNSVNISFTPTSNGNVIVPSGTGSEVTPLFMMDGVRYFRFENLGLSTGSDGGANPRVGVWEFNDASAFGGGIQTTSVTYTNLLIQNFYTGILAGYAGNGAGCDNGILINVVFSTCTLAGLRTASANALNWAVYGGGASGCATDASAGPGGNGGAAYSSSLGSIGPICNMSCTDNKWDVVSKSGNDVHVIGGSCESSGVGTFHCIGMNSTRCQVSGLSYRPLNSLNATMFDASNLGIIHGDCCVFAPGADTGGGVIAALGSNGRVILDAVDTPSNASASTITGSAGSKLYIRNCSFQNANTITGFTGTIGQNI